MRKENGQTRGRKRRRSTCGSVFGAVEGATADREELEHARKYLATREIPRNHVDRLLRKMFDRSQYHCKDNCQKWIQDLLHELDIEMPDVEIDA
ncbi:hypothetical protein MTO96_050533 [Rhipicephalus appendiculatus]